MAGFEYCRHKSVPGSGMNCDLTETIPAKKINTTRNFVFIFFKLLTR